MNSCVKSHPHPLIYSPLSPLETTRKGERRRAERGDGDGPTSPTSLQSTQYPPNKIQLHLSEKNKSHISFWLSSQMWTWSKSMLLLSSDVLHGFRGQVFIHSHKFWSAPWSEQYSASVSNQSVDICKALEKSRNLWANCSDVSSILEDSVCMTIGWLLCAVSQQGTDPTTKFIEDN